LDVAGKAIFKIEFKKGVDVDSGAIERYTKRRHERGVVAERLNSKQQQTNDAFT
jgi:hypothetical protein